MKSPLAFVPHKITLQSQILFNAVSEVTASMDASSPTAMAIESSMILLVLLWRLFIEKAAQDRRWIGGMKGKEGSKTEQSAICDGNTRV